LTRKKSKKERTEPVEPKREETPDLKAEETATPEVEIKKEPTLEEKLRQAEKLLQDKDDRYLRLAAEFDNFKKRASREFALIIKNANEELISELLQVLDDFGRALESVKTTDDFESFHKGIEMVASNFQSLLSRHGLEGIEAKGREFDPELHEAVMQMPSEEVPENIILEEITKGYKLNGKVIRHSQVVVSKGGEGEVPQPAEAETEEARGGEE
jgi:molecular chaperone GrpE